MSWDATRVVVVVNPAARGGRIGREWARLEPELTRRLGPVRYVQTEAAGHARVLAAEAARGGAQVVVSLGGDGTHGEVAAGLMEAGTAAALGVLHAGTGGDFRRILKDSGTLLESAAALPAARATPVDVGEATCVADDGRPYTRVFLNLASAGMSGLVDRLVNASSKRLGGRISFLWCTLRAFFTFRPPTVQVTLDGRDLGTHRLFMLVVANGRWAGGGMCFAPDALPDDGLFDVVLIPALGLFKALWVMPSLYSGRYIRRLGLEVFRGREVVATPTDAHAAWMDLDGEAPGRLPATFRLHPAAVPLLGVDHARLR
ncbi:MAG: diacylglycerol kinase family lipid kinase [bacterium]